MHARKGAKLNLGRAINVAFPNFSVFDFLTLTLF